MVYGSKAVLAAEKKKKNLLIGKANSPAWNSPWLAGLDRET